MVGNKWKMALAAVAASVLLLGSGCAGAGKAFRIGMNQQTYATTILVDGKPVRIVTGK